MLKFILKQWKRKPLGIILIMCGYIIGILVLSVGLSAIQMTKDNLNDLYSGNPDDYSVVSITNSNNLTLNSNDILGYLTKISQKCELQLLNFGKVNIKAPDKNKYYSIIPIIFSTYPKWNIPIINGRYFSESEAKGNSHKVIIGKDIARYFSINANKHKIRINNETYDVIGICGRSYKETQWDDIVYIPLKAIPLNISTNLINRLSTIQNNVRHLNLTFLMRTPKLYAEKLLKDNLNSNFKALNPIISYTNLSKVDKSSLHNAIFFTTTASSIILLITILNVVNLSLFWILDRRKQFAIMMSLGATNKTIYFSVIFEMLLMSISSSIIAVIIQKFLWIVFKGYLLNSGMYFDVSSINIIVSVIIGIICGLITSIFPVIATLKVSPSEALRFE